MSKFQPGDIVQCISDQLTILVDKRSSHSTTSFSGTVIEEGQIYKKDTYKNSWNERVFKKIGEQVTTNTVLELLDKLEDKLTNKPHEKKDKGILYTNVDVRL